MLVAKDKIKSNVGEYFLYMFQIEDLIRACNLNKGIIEHNLVAQYNTDKKTSNEIKEWYFGLADMMKEEKAQSKGHLSFITHKIDEVYDFHLYMLQRGEFAAYQASYQGILSILNELGSRQKEQLNEMHLILNGIYGVYLLKLKKQDISDETLISASKLSKHLAMLSQLFRDYETGKLKIE